MAVDVTRETVCGEAKSESFILHWVQVLDALAAGP